MTCRCVPSVDVTLYRDPASAEGRQARSYFDRKGVRYEDLDVAADSAAFQHMEALSGQHERPVIVVDGRILVGYDQAALELIVPSLF